jgi:hypothetical protein
MTQSVPPSTPTAAVDGPAAPPISVVTSTPTGAQSSQQQQQQQQRPTTGNVKPTQFEDEDDADGAAGDEELEFKIKCSLCGNRFSIDEIADHSAICDATTTPSSKAAAFQCERLLIAWRYAVLVPLGPFTCTRIVLCVMLIC